MAVHNGLLIDVSNRIEFYIGVHGLLLITMNELEIIHLTYTAMNLFTFIHLDKQY